MDKCHESHACACNQIYNIIYRYDVYLSIRPHKASMNQQQQTPNWTKCIMFSIVFQIS